MTHGTGGFSSGGGGGGGFSGGGSGGFSGGGFGGGFTGGAFSGGGLHIYEHHHHHSRNGADCKGCILCFIGSIHIFSFIFCIRKMSRINRIALLWTYVTIAVLTVALLISLRILGTNKFQSAPTDMRRVNDKVSNAFCDSLSINSTDPFQAYAFDDEPAVDPNDVEEFNTTYFMNIVNNNYEYWGFYFLEGSTALVVGSGSATMYVIKGSSNLQAWIDSKGYCSGCYIDKIDTYPSYTYNLKVTERDDYYFVYYSNRFEFTNKASFYIKRTLFNVSTATSSCSFRKGDKPCQFDLSLSSSQNVVYHNGRTATTDQSIDMLSTCHSRAWMYFVVFVFIPVPLAIIASFLFWKFCKDDKTQESSALLQGPGTNYKL